MEPQPGDRVGALACANSEIVQLFGYGVYIGMEYNSDLGRQNPKIQLDSGEVVWGAECWWASESEIEEKIEQYKSLGAEVEFVTVAKFRSDQGYDEMDVLFN